MRMKNQNAKEKKKLHSCYQFYDLTKLKSHMNNGKGAFLLSTLYALTKLISHMNNGRLPKFMSK